jgi:hypothetical protein
LIRALETTAVSNCCDKIFDNPQFLIAALSVVYSNLEHMFSNRILFCVFYGFLIPELADTPPPIDLVNSGFFYS